MITEKANGKSYSEIGKLCGVSGQRIQQSLSPPLLLRERIIKKGDYPLLARIDRAFRMAVQKYIFNVYCIMGRVEYECK